MAKRSHDKWSKDQRLLCEFAIHCNYSLITGMSNLTLVMNEKKHLNFSELRTVLSKYFSLAHDNRQQSKINHTIHDSLMSGFACMYFQDPSLLAFQQRLQDSHQKNNLKTLFSVESIPKETQMRELIDTVDSDTFGPIFNSYFLRLQRSKLLRNYAIIPDEHLYYVPLDGTQYYQSETIHCDKCLTKTSKKEINHYSHQALQASIMHPSMSQVILSCLRKFVTAMGPQNKIVKRMQRKD
jgi:hypothetical protein